MWGHPIRSGEVHPLCIIVIIITVMIMIIMIIIMIIHLS